MGSDDETDELLDESVRLILDYIVKIQFQNGSKYTGTYWYKSKGIITQQFNRNDNPVQVLHNLVGYSIISDSNDYEYKISGVPEYILDFLVIKTDKETPNNFPLLPKLKMGFKVDIGKDEKVVRVAGWTEDNKPLIVLFKINGVQNGEIRVNLNYRKRIYGKLPYKPTKGDPMFYKNYCIGLYSRKEGDVGIFTSTYEVDRCVPPEYKDDKELARIIRTTLNY